MKITYTTLVRMLTGLVVLTLTVLFVPGCNKESYVEGIGVIGSNGVGNGTPGKGRITLYCTNARLDVQCPRLGVSLDYSPIGTIESRASTAPSCGAQSDIAFTLELDPGTYQFQISGSSSGCLSYTFTKTITAGTCVLQQLQ